MAKLKNARLRKDVISLEFCALDKSNEVRGQPSATLESVTSRLAPAAPGDNLPFSLITFAMAIHRELLPRSRSSHHCWINLTHPLGVY